MKNDHPAFILTGRPHPPRDYFRKSRAIRATETFLPDPIAKAPDLQASGKAWLCDIVAGRAMMGKPEGGDAVLATWLIEAVWWNPHWHSYAIVLLHLRPLPGMPPPVIHIPGATHEMWLFALDPETDREALIAGPTQTNMRVLLPVNFAAQFIARETIDKATSDQVALSMIRQVVTSVIEARLDPGHPEPWRRLFGHAIMTGAGSRIDRRQQEALTAMTEEALRGKFRELKQIARDEAIRKEVPDKALDALLIGLDIFEELFVDIHKIATAAETGRD